MSEYFGYGMDDFVALFGECAVKFDASSVRVNLGGVKVLVTFSEWAYDVDVSVEYFGRIYECTYDGCDTWIVDDVLDACDRAIEEAVAREARDFESWNQYGED